VPRVLERFWRGGGIGTPAGSGVGLTVVDRWFEPTAESSPSRVSPVEALASK
jgi:signal transduction histidine kinase